MAKCKVVGNVAMVMSDHSMEELRLVRERCPRALCLERIYGDDAEVYFRVFLDAPSVGVSQHGISFGADTPGDEQRAVVNVEIPASGMSREDIEKWVEKEIGRAVLNLKQVDTQVTSALLDIRRENENIKSAIEYVEI